MKYFLVLTCVFITSCGLQVKGGESTAQNTIEKEDIYITTFGDEDSGYMEVDKDETIKKGSIIMLHGSLVTPQGEELTGEEINFGYYDTVFEPLFTILSNQKGQYFAKTKLEKKLKNNIYYIDVQVGGNISRIVFLKDITQTADVIKDISIEKYYYTKISKKDEDYAIGLDISLIESP